MIYIRSKNRPPDPAIIINEVIHLEPEFSEDIYNFSSTKCVDYNRQLNIFFANFKHANFNIRNA